MLEVDGHGLLAVTSVRVEADRVLNLGLTTHDAVHSHALAARVRGRA